MVVEVGGVCRNDSQGEQFMLSDQSLPEGYPDPAPVTPGGQTSLPRGPESITTVDSASHASVLVGSTLPDIRGFPVETHKMSASVTVSDTPLASRHKITRDETFVEAVNRLMHKLDHHLHELGATTESLPTRPLSGGLLAGIWNHLVFSKMWCDANPREVFDVVRNGPNGGETYLYRVTILQAHLSRRLDIHVEPYQDGGELAAKAAKEAAAILKEATMQPKDMISTDPTGGSQNAMSQHRKDAENTDPLAESVSKIIEDRQRVKEAFREMGLGRRSTVTDFQNLETFTKAAKGDLIQLERDILSGEVKLSENPDKSVTLGKYAYTVPDFERVIERRKGYWRLSYEDVLRSKFAQEQMGELSFLSGVCSSFVAAMTFKVTYGLGSWVLLVLPPLAIAGFFAPIAASFFPLLASNAYHYLTEMRPRAELRGAIKRITKSNAPGLLGETLAKLKTAGLDWKLTLKDKRDDDGGCLVELSIFQR